mmetsp:Transcript_18428/g.33194  ORF Transcript_18428/g.33194 Transcript_18428/m.33194 type:complete len:114 (+) Transcript_18428:2412-2753(+)
MDGSSKRSSRQREAKDTGDPQSDTREAGEVIHELLNGESEAKYTTSSLKELAVSHLVVITALMIPIVSRQSATQMLGSASPPNCLCEWGNASCVMTSPVWGGSKRAAYYIRLT